ncbi:hypothetical protein Nm8I071_63770 [Nonomuraea sp. TT08I-71]|nr:hypothetical protein Nm8I071_63770 [Nonomuraea sp. TT08I-71]
MTGPVWLVAVFLTGAALAVAWPVRAGRARRHAVLDLGNRPGRDEVPTMRACSGAGPGPMVRSPHPSGLQRRATQPGPPAGCPPPGRPPGRRDPTRPTSGLLRAARGYGSGRTALLPSTDHPERARSAIPPVPADPTPGSRWTTARLLAGRAIRPRLFAFAADGTFRLTVGGSWRSEAAASASSHGVARAPLVGRTALPAAAVVGAGAGALVGGPVAAVVLAAYGTLAARAVRRRRLRRAADRAHRHDLDQLGALAADLRAGLPPGRAIADGPRRVARLARAAVRLADRTGAPLAELLERVEADARAADRGLAAAAAQAAGARATAWLLAGLPLGGIGLGYAIGVDPVAVLLHTPVGGGSAVAAVALQIGGLIWAERLGAAPGRAA